MYIYMGDNCLCIHFIGVLLWKGGRVGQSVVLDYYHDKVGNGVVKTERQDEEYPVQI